MTPRNRLVYCRYLDPEATLPGGRIILTDASLKAITGQQGVVEAVAPYGYDEDGTRVTTDPHLQPGALILHTAYKRIPCKDDAHFFVHEDDVVAVLEGDNDHEVFL